MKSQILATAALLTIISTSQTAHAANPEHLRQLLSSKKCPNCDLSGAGLVMADLSGADLSGANLAGANLSRANLTGADLRNTNLSGTSLFGANLTASKLTGATLVGTDLRHSYLHSAELTGIDLKSANLQGAIGIPLQNAKPEEFYAWGIAEAQKGNHQQAIDYFNQAIAVKPDYAGAYLARGIARYQIMDKQGAFQDAQVADKLFTAEKNAAGMQTAQAFIQELQTPYTDPAIKPSKPTFVDFVGSIGSLLLQFLPF
ncbi:hypothetical protein NUACC21_76970 [Scytonema sp. NUACC21]